MKCYLLIMSEGESRDSDEAGPVPRVDQTKGDGFQALAIAAISAVLIFVLFMHFTR
jgi:hypothetical protein